MKIAGRTKAGMPVLLGAMLLTVVGAHPAMSRPAQSRLTQIGTLMEVDGKRLAVSPAEVRALANLGNLVRSGRKAAQDRALAEARRVADSADARYALAIYELEIGRDRGDATMRVRALDVLIASPVVESDRLSGYLATRGQIAFDAGAFAIAGELWERQAELAPSDPVIQVNLAQVRLAQQNVPLAMDLITRAINAHESGGKPAPEIWHRQRLSIAQQGNLVQQGIDAARALVSAYPTSENWRAALVVYRQLAAPDGPAEIDLLRFMRRANILAKADEYQRTAQLLGRAGHVEEAKQVLAEGLARNLLEPDTSPTREIIAEIAKPSAAPPSAVASAEQGEDVRRGVSHLMADHCVDAVAAFQAAVEDVDAGPYRDIGFFWLAWLTRGLQGRSAARCPV